jgi:hypothetical protein
LPTPSCETQAASAAWPQQQEAALQLETHLAPRRLGDNVPPETTAAQISTTPSGTTSAALRFSSRRTCCWRAAVAVSLRSRSSAISVARSSSCPERKEQRKVLAQARHMQRLAKGQGARRAPCLLRSVPVAVRVLRQEAALAPRHSHGECVW